MLKVEVAGYFVGQARNVEKAEYLVEQYMTWLDAQGKLDVRLAVGGVVCVPYVFKEGGRVRYEGEARLELTTGAYPLGVRSVNKVFVTGAVMDISNVRARFENVSSMLAGLRGLSSAAANGACGSGTNESTAVRDFGFGVTAYCEAIVDRMELLWQALDDELMAAEVSHAKADSASQVVRAAA